MMLLATVLAASASCSLTDDGPERDASGALIEPGEVEALDLRLGDCFNGPGAEGGETVLTVMVVPCDQLHEFEVYHAFDLADGDFPGMDVVQNLWISGCLDEFERFVGVPFDESDLDISGIFPTEETWNDLNDREVLCSVTAVSGEPRSGSARGARL
ncbi:MAG: septum formation family protein [Acidimicrobiia bacterium]|nr:septum formation family protein [Acidimicrobiia bacterium]